MNKREGDPFLEQKSKHRALEDANRERVASLEREVEESRRNTEKLCFQRFNRNWKCEVMTAPFVRFRIDMQRALRDKPVFSSVLRKSGLAAFLRGEEVPPLFAYQLRNGERTLIIQARLVCADVLRVNNTRIELEIDGENWYDDDAFYAFMRFVGNDEDAFSGYQLSMLRNDLLEHLIAYFSLFVAELNREMEAPNLYPDARFLVKRIDEHRTPYPVGGGSEEEAE